jgi:hypothetical protein
VLERVGISAEEAERFKAPERYAGAGGTVPQPAYDPTKPHQAYPAEMYKAMIAMPDEMVGQMVSYNKPPVAVSSD